jgi:hypothetical protein
LPGLHLETEVIDVACVIDFPVDESGYGNGERLTGRLVGLLLHDAHDLSAAGGRIEAFQI